jgi:antitoxin MazE
VVRLVDRPHYTLKELLAGVTPDNLHGEIDTGHSVGDESW